MEKTSRKAKTRPGEFKVTTPKNPLINNQAISRIKNLITILSYPKIPIGLDLVAAFFPLLHKSPICFLDQPPCL